MFRPCGVIIRPLQFDEAVRHKQDNEQINNILLICSLPDDDPTGSKHVA
jgi:hypothetical protein